MAIVKDSSVWTEDRLRSQVAAFHDESYSWENLVKHELGLQKRPKAAVLVPLHIRDGQPYVWLTERSDFVKHDKGNVSFPGGMKNPEDATAVDTCLREAHEEIGLDPDDVEILVELLPCLHTRLILVTPIIGLVSSNFIPKPNQEVSLCFSLPVERFLSSENYAQRPYEIFGQKSFLQFFSDYINGDVVQTWGMTATIITEIAVGLFKRLPEFEYSLPLTVDKPFSFHETYLQLHEEKHFGKYANKSSDMSKV